MKWLEIKGFVDLLGLIAESVKSRKLRKWTRKIEMWVGETDTLQAIRLKWRDAENNGTALTLSVEEVQYIKRVRERVL